MLDAALDKCFYNVYTALNTNLTFYKLTSYSIFRLIMFDLDPNPIVQLEPQTSSNVNIENPLTYSTSKGRKKIQKDNQKAH